MVALEIIAVNDLVLGLCPQDSNNFLGRHVSTITEPSILQTPLLMIWGMHETESLFYVGPKLFRLVKVGGVNLWASWDFHDGQ